MKRIVIGILSILAAAFSVQAADPENLSDWKLGEVQIGEAFTHAELKGQVVVLEYWGAW